MSVTPIRHTYCAKLMSVRASGLEFHIAGTLDGFVDFCIIEESGRHVTHNITRDDAIRLIAGLHSVIQDINANCLFDKDLLLERQT